MLEDLQIQHAAEGILENQHFEQRKRALTHEDLFVLHAFDSAVHQLSQHLDIQLGVFRTLHDLLQLSEHRHAYVVLHVVVTVQYQLHAIQRALHRLDGGLADLVVRVLQELAEGDRGVAAVFAKILQDLRQVEKCRVVVDQNVENALQYVRLQHN